MKRKADKNSLNLFLHIFGIMRSIRSRMFYCCRYMSHAICHSLVSCKHYYGCIKRFPLCYSEALIEVALSPFPLQQSCPPSPFCDRVKPQGVIYLLTFLNEDNQITPCSLTVVPSLWSAVLIGAATYVVFVHIC